MIAPAPAADGQAAPLSVPPAHSGAALPARARLIAGELALGLLFVEGWSALRAAAPWPVLGGYTALMVAAAALFYANPYRAAPLYRILYVAGFGIIAFAVNLLTAALARPGAGVWSLYLLYGIAASFPVLLFPLRIAVLLELGLWLACAANVLAMGQWSAVPGGTLTALASLTVGFLSVVVLTYVSRHAHERSLETAVAALPAAAPAVTVRPPDTGLSIEELAAIRERNRMAQEIHDTLGHHLTVLNVQLEAAIRLAQSDPERSFLQLTKAKESAASALREVRAAVSTLRPQRLEQGSLKVALERMVTNFSSGTGLPVDLTISGLVRQLAPNEETVLYRCVQESLTNIQKHARATRASVTLRYNPDATELAVADNGVGSPDPSGGMGLLGIRERVEGVGGTVTIRTKPGAGLILLVSLPAPMPSDPPVPSPSLATSGAPKE